MYSFEPVAHCSTIRSSLPTLEEALIIKFTHHTQERSELSWPSTRYLGETSSASCWVCPALPDSWPCPGTNSCSSLAVRPASVGGGRRRPAGSFLSSCFVPGSHSSRKSRQTCTLSGSIPRCMRYVHNYFIEIENMNTEINEKNCFVD